MAECFPTFANVITIRGLDTISITPSSQLQMKCMEENSVLDNEGNYVCTSTGNGSLRCFDKYSRPFFTDFYGELVHRRTIPQTGCKHYLDYEEFTYIFVDDILKTAEDVINRMFKRSAKFEKRRPSSSRNILSWPTIGNFDIALGKSKIREYIDCTSEMTEDWSYSINLIAEHSDKISDFYKFEVKFGIPTKCFPVAQATASVFFNYEVSRVKPRHCPVDVTYQIEASSCVMIPGRNYITENLLLRVLDTKIAYFQRIEN